MKHNNYIAYLGGPITGVSFDSCVDWREDIAKMFPEEIQGLSPMRGKDYLEGLGKIESSYENSVLSCSRGIMTRDYNDCTRADVVIINLWGAKRISIGTVMEMAWAWDRRIPIIAIMEKEGNCHEHSMLGETIGYRVKNLREAVDIATALLLPVPHRKNKDF